MTRRVFIANIYIYTYIYIYMPRPQVIYLSYFVGDPCEHNFKVIQFVAFSSSPRNILLTPRKGNNF